MQKYKTKLEDYKEFCEDWNRSHFMPVPYIFLVKTKMTFKIFIKL